MPLQCKQFQGSVAIYMNRSFGQCSSRPNFAEVLYQCKTVFLQAEAVLTISSSFPLHSAPFFRKIQMIV